MKKILLFIFLFAISFVGYRVGLGGESFIQSFTSCAFIFCADSRLIQGTRCSYSAVFSLMRLIHLVVLLFCHYASCQGKGFVLCARLGHFLLSVNSSKIAGMNEVYAYIVGVASV